VYKGLTTKWRKPGNLPQRNRSGEFPPIGPKARDLDVSRVDYQARTGDRRKDLGGLASSSQMPIIRADSWFTTKAMPVAPPRTSERIVNPVER